jgi:hypothetical protein
LLGLQQAIDAQGDRPGLREILSPGGPTGDHRGDRREDREMNWV